jgi:transcriptional regulator with XRE-family HTH domain
MSQNYNSEILKSLEPALLKDLLAHQNISYSDIAKDLNISKATISLIINQEYTGAEDTINMVYTHIAFRLTAKVDLNEIIYPSPGFFKMVFMVAIKKGNFKADEIIELSRIYKILDEYSINQKSPALSEAPACSRQEGHT